MKETTKKTIIHVALFAIALIAIVIMALRIEHLKTENRVYRENQATLMENHNALLKTCESYEYRDSLNGISVGRLQLDVDDLREYNSYLIDLCKDLKINVKDVKSATQVASDMIVELQTPMRDTIIINNSQPIKAKSFEWGDNYVNVNGVIDNDSVRCKVESYDTIKQIVHRVPKCKLFRWGTKGIRQEIVTSNPHTKLVYSEYIELRE